MADEHEGNPFKIGDRVAFLPDDRAVGWSWANFDRLRLKPGDNGIVSRRCKQLIDHEHEGLTRDPIPMCTMIKRVE